jgi:hypothetical protein
MIDDSQICMPCIISITYELETRKGLGSLGKPLQPPVNAVQLCADHIDMQLGIGHLFFLPCRCLQGELDGFVISVRCRKDCRVLMREATCAQRRSLPVGSRTCTHGGMDSRKGRRVAGEVVVLHVPLALCEHPPPVPRVKPMEKFHSLEHITFVLWAISAMTEEELREQYLG